jgi:hypothetical protein
MGLDPPLDQSNLWKGGDPPLSKLKSGEGVRDVIGVQNLFLLFQTTKFEVRPGLNTFQILRDAFHCAFQSNFQNGDLIVPQIKPGTRFV